MFYIPVQDVDMLSTIHPKPKTFGERFKAKFYVWYKLKDNLSLKGNQKALEINLSDYTHF